MRQSLAALILTAAALSLPQAESSSRALRGAAAPLEDERSEDGGTAETYSDANANRVVGGKEADEGLYSYAVNLVENGLHFCAGSVISRQYVLSAAHCIAKRLDRKLHVQINRHYRKQPDYVEIPIVEIILHPHHMNGFNWIGGHLADDVVLLKLGRAVPNSVTPVKINVNPTVPRENDELTVMGWGTINEDKVWPQMLLEGEVEYQTNEMCQQSTDGFLTYGKLITNDMMCAASLGVDTCYGDSGGPLVVRRGDDASKHVQVGVVSWGFGCARKEFAGVYSRISHNADWFAEVLCDGRWDEPDFCKEMQAEAPAPVPALPAPTESTTEERCTVGPVKRKVPCADFRYVPWDKMQPTKKVLAQLKLGYTKTRWNNPGTAEIESRTWEQLSDDQKIGANTIGFYQKESWDCYQHHFRSYSWDALASEGVRVHYRTLGWRIQSWPDSPPATYDLSWSLLSSEQRDAAKELCYTKEVWDGIGL